jgi:hypothetical protein
MTNLLVNENLAEYEDQEDDVRTSNYAITSYGADYPVDGLVKRIRNGNIYIPEFQRGFVWDIKTASRFIESLLIGLPVPGIFLSKDQESKLIVIDGQQRLRTIQYFYDGKIPIHGDYDFEESNTDGKVFALKLDGNDNSSEELGNKFNNKTYNTLSDEERRRLDDAIIPATIIKQDIPENDDSSIYQIFERLNTGGIKLTSQEIRACIYHGEFNKLLIELNKNSQWQDIFNGKITGNFRPDPRMKDQELILRFLALHSASIDYDGDNEKTITYQKPMKSFLNEFMKQNRQINNIKKEQLINIFNHSIETIYNSIGLRAFRPKKGLNAAVLDAVLVGITRHLERGLINQLDQVRLEYDNLLKNQYFLSNSTETARTTETSIVKSRLKLAIDAFKNIE